MPHRGYAGNSLGAAAIVAATSASAQVTGFVGDLSLVPLQGAIVSVQATDIRTASAADSVLIALRPVPQDDDPTYAAA